MEYIHISKSNNKPYPDCVILVEHPSVYTLGRGGTPENIKFNTMSKDSRVYRVSRGGEVTWHGPGQLVAYPIIDLTEHKKDLRWYITKLEESVIRTLHSCGIVGGRSDVNPGVWIGNRKVCAVGVAASRWITMHGLALNVTCDLSPYNSIVPCGISPDIGGVTSMAAEVSVLPAEKRWCGNEINEHSPKERLFYLQVKARLTEYFMDEFNFEGEHSSVTELDRLLTASSVDIQNDELQVVQGNTSERI